MDDQRLIARLRAVRSAGDPRPAFVEELHAELAVRLGLQEEAVGTRVRPSSTSRLLLLAATIALLVALAVGAIMVGSALNVIRLPTSILQTIRDNGAVRVAVRTDAPQTMTALGSLDGFDVEFARYIGDRLGAQTHLIPTSATAMLANSNEDWQLALPSQTLTADDLTRFAVTDSYYAWPLYLVAQSTSSVADTAALANQPICAASGTAAELWLLGGGMETALNVRHDPPSADVHLLSDDAACVAEVRSGASAALVTSRMLANDLAATPDLRIIGEGPVAFEPRAMIVPRSAVGEDELIAELNLIIRSARMDGGLAVLSRRWFGGSDLTSGL